MAEKRMVHRNITKSDKLLHIAETRGWRACFLYAAHIPYLDKSGRMKANHYGLKGITWEVWPVTAEEIAGDLDALAEVGLIRLYRTPKGEVVMQYAKFDEEHGGFNKPHPNEPDSEYPDPDADGCRDERISRVVGNVPTNVVENVVHNNPPQRSDKVAPEYELEKEKEIEKEVSQELSSTSSTRERHTLAIQVWNEHRQNLPAVTAINKKRRAAVDALAKEHGDDALDLLRDATLAVANEDFWNERGYGFDNLVPTKVLRYAEKWRAGHAQLGTANTRMATQVHRWAQALDALDERPVN